MNHADKGDKFDVDLTLDQARPGEFDASMIPGGLFNPDVMRTNERAQNFARHFFRESRPVAVICQAPQVLINADLVRGRKMTSWPAIRVDMRNAGAGSTRKSSLITDWSRAANLTTFQLSIGK